MSKYFIIPVADGLEAIIESESIVRYDHRSGEPIKSDTMQMDKHQFVEVYGVIHAKPEAGGSPIAVTDKDTHDMLIKYFYERAISHD